MIREKTILSSLVVVSLLYFSHLTREFIHKLPDLTMAKKKHYWCLYFNIWQHTSVESTDTKDEGCL